VLERLAEVRRRYVERGQLPAYKIGEHIRIAEEDLRVFISSSRLRVRDIDEE
jgi:hypothetical protein